MDITKFCNPDAPDARAYLRMPMRDGGYLYATDGAVIVRIEDDPAVEASPLDERVRRTFETLVVGDNSDRAWQPIPCVDPKTLLTCPNCKGSGRLIPCLSCDGEGEFEHHDHTYSCRACDGYGTRSAPPQCPDGISVECFACGGSGVHPFETIDFGAPKIAHGYVHLIRTQIPAAEIGISGDPAGIQIFRAPGVLGGVMGCCD